jgi:hypothetical protein
MQSKIDVISLSISKSKPEIPSFLKYDIETVIDEIENNDESFTMKFSFILLSELKIVRIGVDGIVRISGSQLERENVLQSREDGIPDLVHLIYLHLYPEFFMLTKSINVPCPPYNISKISKSVIEDTSIESTSIQKENVINNENHSQNIENNSISEPVMTPNQEIQFEEMTTDELSAQYSKLTDDYNKNPNNETLMKINKISQITSNKQKNDKILETPNV